MADSNHLPEGDCLEMRALGLRFDWKCWVVDLEPLVMAFVATDDNSVYRTIL